MDTVIGNITDAVKKGVVEIAQQALKEIFNVLQSLPTPYIPNTVDFALSLIPVAVPVLDLSRGGFSSGFHGDFDHGVHPERSL